MDRIFWVECPKCTGKFYCDYEMRFAGFDLQCPFCQKNFPVSESPWLDDRG